MDTLFSLHTKRIVWLYAFLYLTELGFILLVYYLADMLLLMFSFISMLMLLMFAYAHLLISRRVRGVARMVEIRHSEWRVERELSLLREFALMTQSWTVTRWILLTYVTISLNTALPLLAAFVYVVYNGVAPTLQLAFVGAYVAYALLCVLALSQVRRNFYLRAIVLSFCKVLPAKEDVVAYARTRWAVNVNTLFAAQRQNNSKAVAYGELMRSFYSTEAHKRTADAISFSEKTRNVVAPSSSKRPKRKPKNK